MKRILVIGSIAIDNVIYTTKLPGPGTTVFGESFLSNIGGKGANQACAIKFLGGDVEFLGAVGNDDNGERVQKFLKSVNLKGNLKISDKNTGVASITIDTSCAENRIVIVPGANMDIWPADIDKINFKKFDYLLLQLENPMETVVYAMKKAKEAGLTVVLNPAPCHLIPKEAYQYIDFFIPNEHELDQFVPDVYVFEAKCRELINQGIKRVIVTLGANGSMYVDKDQCFNVDPVRVNAVDTTAAGDSFCGALLIGLADDLPVKDAMEFASKASSITVTRKGAISSLPKLEDL